jgi:hypothetical protein
MYKIDENINKKITIDSLLNLKNNEKLKKTEDLFEQQEYKPTRSAIRFFLFHFF